MSEEENRSSLPALTATLALGLAAEAHRNGLPAVNKVHTRPHTQEG